MSTLLRIGALATQMKLPVETIRYYEREGLLPQPQRTEGNYRLYDGDLADRLAFIRNCRALDMTLEEIRQMLVFRDAPDDACGGVNEVLDEHIEHLTQRISELRGLRNHLQELRGRCTQEKTTAACKILKGLSKEEVPKAASRSGESVGAKRHLRSHR